MTVDEAIRRVFDQFPFKGYLPPIGTAKGAYSNIASTVLRYLQPGDAILDFGCGPCDKTAGSPPRVEGVGWVLWLRLSPANPILKAS